MKDNKGFSLIEVIIAIAIIAIMTVGGIAGFGYLNLANASKCASKIDSGLTVLKSKNMANASPAYMHLYYYDGDYYILYDDTKEFIPDATNYEQGEQIGNANITISFDDTDISELDNQCVNIGMRKKDGAFTYTSDPTSKITVSGQTSYDIILVTSTGKHFRE